MVEEVPAAFSRTFGRKIDVLENIENEAPAQIVDLMERPMRIELTPEPWQISRQWNFRNLQGTFRNIL